MTSTSCKTIARDLLDRVMAGGAPDVLPPALLGEECGQSLFGVFVEGMADRFDPALCAVYARLFSQAVASVAGADADALVRHYEAARRVRPVEDEPRVVSVLSRVTLGADVAVTSVLLDAARRRFPRAEIRFLGPRKNWELFAADPRLAHVEVNYRRGGLRERLSVWDELRAALDVEGGLVIDPDSRLTQLGLLPVCPIERYRLFESRAYGGDGAQSLPELAAAWAEETLGVAGARRYVALAGGPGGRQGIAVSLGVGENAAKRLDDPFEEELLRLLAATGLPVAIDCGAGGEERERVQRAVARSGAQVELCEGSFAEFAAVIAGSCLYAGYDSAGQHVAAACGVPLIGIFAGFPCERMFERWKPAGEKATILRIDDRNPAAVLARVAHAL